MGKTSCKKYTPEFKAQVVIEALKEQSTLAGLAANLSAGCWRLWTSIRCFRSSFCHKSL